MPFSAKTEQWLVFWFSLFVGAFVWIASPYFTRQIEPWDSPGMYYRGVLLVGGVVAGLLVPRRFWLWAISIWLGQMVGFAWCIATTPGSVGPLMPLGLLVFLPIYSLWGLAGSCIGAGIGKLLRVIVLGRRT